MDDAKAGPQFVRVVTEAPRPDGACRTQGTQLIMPDGTPIKGVTKVTLVACVNDVWRAHVELIVAPPPELHAVIADVTTLASTECEYVKVEAATDG